MTSDNEYMLYYFDDKDLFDAIFSTRRHFSDLFLRDQAANRGIFFSYRGDSRKYISNFFATWFNDFEMLSIIKDRLSIAQRRPRYEPERIVTEDNGAVVPVPPDKIEDALEVIKDNFSDKSMQSFDFTKNKDGSFTGVYNYVDIDYSQTTLKQQRKRADSIIVRPSDNGLEISAPCGSGGDKIKDLLVTKLSESNLKVKRVRIELKGDATAEERFVFFRDIIIGMCNMTLETVTELRLSSVDVQVDGDTDVDNDQQAAREFTKLLKAHLQGSNLFDTIEFQELKAKGFFPFEVRWWVRDDATRDLIELSAGFAEAGIGKGFKCDALAIKNWSDTKRDNYKSKEGLKKDIHVKYKHILESRVYAVYEMHHSLDGS